jgi:DNA polymerase I-like protein with 3'-5' exonuclease and polymerase domains
LTTLTFDLETDGLYRECTRIHCAVIYDHDEDRYHTFDPTDVHRLPEILKEADVLIGHNIVGFDVPVINKLFGIDLHPHCKLIDTFLLSKLAYYDIEDHLAMSEPCDPKLKSSHGLKAWGQRLKLHKGDYGTQEDAWTEYDKDMLDYCKQDVKVTTTLYRHLMRRGNVPQRALRLEQDFARVIQKQTAKGWYFDVKKAQQLHVQLHQQREEIERELSTVFLPMYCGTNTDHITEPAKIKTYKKGTYIRKCAVTGVRVEYGTHTPIKLTEFNAGSRQHIHRWLHAMYKWKPKKYTENGSAIIDSTVLNALPYPEAQLLGKYFELQKILGMLIEGKNGWLKVVNDESRINGELDTIGAVSGRCTHRSPNLAQVPSSRAFKGKECRELFTVPTGKVLIGCDASGLELRMLAHYLYRYDGGEYADAVVDGDIHTTNQEAAGLDTRDQAKTFIYAFLYGAGDSKLGSIKGNTNMAKNGKELKAKFFKAIPAIEELLEQVKVTAEKGYIRGVTGRRLHIRSPHSALNTLLQSAGAYVMKYYTVALYEALSKYKDKVLFVGNIHDEVQLEVSEDIKEEVRVICEDIFKDITTLLKFKVPLEGEARIGITWNDTH